LIAWGEADVDAFPWFEKPPAAAIERALELLEALDAIHNRSLTESGKRMAQFPLQPRLAKMLLSGERFGAPNRTTLCCALLSEREPFRRSADFAIQHKSDSDVIDRLTAVEEFSRTQRRETPVGEILVGPAKRILQASDQLRKLIASDAGKPSLPPDLVKSDEPILRALTLAFPDRICRRREPKGRRGVMVGGRGVRLAD